MGGLASYYSDCGPTRWARHAGATLADIPVSVASAGDPGRLSAAPGAHPTRLDQAVRRHGPHGSDTFYPIALPHWIAVGLLLDARIRSLTDGARSLDDVMRLAYRRFSGERGYTPAEFRAVAEEVAGADLGEFFRAAVETAGELDYREMLDWYGLRFTPAGPDSAGKPWLGADTKVKDGRLVVTDVPRDAPAWGSGLTAEDELIALDDFRLEDGDLDTALQRYGPDDMVSVLVSRLGELRRYRLKLGRAPGDRWSLSVRPDATPTNGGGWPPGSASRTDR